MLREDTLKTIQAAIARGEPVAPGPDAVRALAYEASRMRAHAMRDAVRKAFAWLLTMPASRVDVVRGH
jgi:hypothetical protein